MHPQKAVRAAINKAAESGFVTITGGNHGALLCSIAYPCSKCGMPVASKREYHESCPSGPEGLFVG